jgi:hypothetical protein
MTSSHFENLALDLSIQLNSLTQEGKLTPPFKVSMTDADDRFLGSFEMYANGTSSPISENNFNIADALFPVTVSVVDSQGNHYEMIWSPPAIQ